MINGDVEQAFGSNVGEASTWKWFSFNDAFAFQSEQTDSEHEGGVVKIEIESGLRNWLKERVFCLEPGGSDKSRIKSIRNNNPKVKHENSQITVGIPKASYMEFYKLAKPGIKDVQEGVLATQATLTSEEGGKQEE